MESVEFEKLAREELLNVVREVVKRNDRLLSLNKLVKTVNSIFDYHQLLDYIMEEATKTIKGEASSLALLSEDKKSLYFMIAKGEKSGEVKKLRLKPGEGIVGWVTEKGEVAIVNDVMQDSRFYKKSDEATGFKTHSVLCVPLKIKEEVIGALEVINKVKEEGGIFTSEDAELLLSFASHAALSIEKARLYKKLEEKVVELEKAYKRLKELQMQLVRAERLAALGEMSAVVAHEIRNPLNSISGLTQLLQGKVDDSNKKYLTLILQEVDRLNRVVGEILEFSRKPTLKLTRTDLNKLIEGVILLLKTDLEKKDISIETNLSKLKELFVDEAQIKQVLLNLIQNSIQATEEGEGKIVVSTSLGEGMIKVEVRDNGCGIPEENLKKLFEPFFTTKMYGTGLGLPITKRIIEDHGGTIEVESKVGEGTTMKVFLPIKEST